MKGPLDDIIPQLEIMQSDLVSSANLLSESDPGTLLDSVEYICNAIRLLKRVQINDG